MTGYEEEEMNYEEDMIIDPDRLDIAALEQSNLAMRYSEIAARYEKIVKKAHEKVKVLRAQLIKEVNDNPEELLGPGIKATGANAEAYYRNHPDHISAKNELINAEYNRDLAKAASDHISFQRKKMIEILVQLLQNEYFSGPSVPRNITDEWNKTKKCPSKEERRRRRRRSHKRREGGANDNS